MSIHFGTGGWRAIIGDEFTKANIRILAEAMSRKMKAEGCKPLLAIGYDRRFLAKEAVQWASEVFAAHSITVQFVNRSSPTPLIMFYVMKHELDYGMMVTASHNPSLYNGFKVFTKGGRDADEGQTADLERYISQTETDMAGGFQIPAMDYPEALQAGLVVEFNPLNEYLDSIISRLDMEAIRRSGLRVVLDPLYGVSQTSLQTILSTARCYMETIHSGHDTLFAGKMPAPSADTLKALQNYVVDYRYDIGVATDGDADRIGVIDDQGNYLHANDILVLLYYYLVKYKGWSGPVVRNLSTTHMLDRVAESFGQSCYEVPVGFKYISRKMEEVDAVIGGESSGGLTIRGHINGKDGVYAACLLVEMIAVTGKPLSKICANIRRLYGSLFMEERAYSFTQEQKENLNRLLMTERRIPALPFEAEKISYLDGCKVYFKNGGWVSARFSGTEPLLRIFCEMETPSDAANICRIWEDFLGLGQS